MDKDLKDRTEIFALDIIKLINAIPSSKTADVLCKQLLRCACSVGANYRSARRAQSTAHFISKLSIVVEESDEAVYWLDLIIKSNTATGIIVERLRKEANELTAIFTASLKTSKNNYKRSIIKKKTKE